MITGGSKFKSLQLALAICFDHDMIGSQSFTAWCAGALPVLALQLPYISHDSHH